MSINTHPRPAAMTLLALFAAVGGLMLNGCRRDAPDRLQGYLEGEFVHVAAPLSGQVERVAVVKGSSVEAGAVLFELERAAELAARRQADERLASARARLDDLRKGSRPSELDTLQARLRQAAATAELSAIELGRAADLLEKKVAPQNEYDRARLSHERDKALVEELSAQLTTARLGGRPDAVSAAEAEVAAAVAAQAQAAWAVDRKVQRAPRGALVYDTLFREGEFAAAGQPVVTLLPPENLKVRFFVPEEKLAGFPVGARVLVALGTRAAPLEGRVSYVSPKPEFTPPVLYNRENRAKLVFMVEAALPADNVRGLNPGQPVDVSLAPGVP